jgi:hypothetical protein
LGEGHAKQATKSAQARKAALGKAGDNNRDDGAKDIEKVRMHGSTWVMRERVGMVELG